METLGLEATTTKFQQHWQSALTDADFNFLTRTAHINKIRLPIGYFTLGPDFCKGTPFEKFSSVYTNAWSHVLDLISRCDDHGVGVLIDFHALPGGANKDSHSGTSSGKADLWTSKSNQDLAIKCLTFLATDISSHPNITGLQLLNEAIYAAPGLHAFYDRAITAISTIDPTLPIYISDAWNLASTVKYALTKNQLPNRTNPILTDTHKYWTISATDRAKHPQQIISEIQTSPSPLFPTLPPVITSSSPPTATSLFVGEHSNTLSASTWSLLPDSPNSTSHRKSLTQAFGLAQSALYTTHAAGAMYWSYKFSWANHTPGPRGLVHTHGGDWGFRNQVDSHAVAAPVWLRLSRRDVGDVLREADQDGKKEGLARRARAEHVEYWRSRRDGTGGGEAYARGWTLGWEDARVFFGWRVAAAGATDDGGSGRWLGSDTIGALDLWILKRVREIDDLATTTWEWEHGFRRGVGDFQGLIRQSDT